MGLYAPDYAVIGKKFVQPIFFSLFVSPTGEYSLGFHLVIQSVISFRSRRSYTGVFALSPRQWRFKLYSEKAPRKFFNSFENRIQLPVGKKKVAFVVSLRDFSASCDRIVYTKQCAFPCSGQSPALHRPRMHTDFYRFCKYHTTDIGMALLFFNTALAITKQYDSKISSGGRSSYRPIEFHAYSHCPTRMKPRKPAYIYMKMKRI